MNPGPCIKCGARNYPNSLGGPYICPLCDCGEPSIISPPIPNIPYLYLSGTCPKHMVVGFCEECAKEEMERLRSSLASKDAEIAGLKEANEKLQEELEAAACQLGAQDAALARARDREEAMGKAVEAGRITVAAIHKGDDPDRVARCIHPLCAALRALDAGKGAGR
jgi:hypothetical protein